MTRLVSLLFLSPLALALAGCAASAPGPSAPAGNPEASAVATQAGDATPNATPDPLPTIPPRLPNEVIRGTFSTASADSESATHAFSGQAVAVHVLCASYDGAVEVALMLDGEQEMTNTSACDTPHVVIEDDSFNAGTHAVTFEIAPTGGAEGVVYLVEGDI